MSEEIRQKIYTKNSVPKIDKKSIKILTDYVNSLPQTKSMHTDESGTYTPERLKVHKNIIDQFKSNVVCVETKKPTAILMGGSPASGKSTFLKKYAPYLLQDEILRIDADEIRAKLPEYEGWNASQTHLETKDIVNTLLSNKTIGIPCQFDLIYDGTMNTAKSYGPLIKLLKKLGYQIFIVYINNVPKEETIKRALNRYKSSGRFVPLEVIDDFFEKGKTALNQLKKSADGYMIIDGSSKNYDVIEQKGIALPKSRAYSKIGFPMDAITKKVGELSDEEVLDRAKKIIADQVANGSISENKCPPMTLFLAKEIVEDNMRNPEQFKKGGKVGWWRDHYYQSDEPHETKYAKRNNLIRQRYSSAKKQRGGKITDNTKLTKKDYDKLVDSYRFYIVNIPSKLAVDGYPTKKEAERALSHYGQGFSVLNKSKLRAHGIENPNEYFKKMQRSGVSEFDSEEFIKKQPEKALASYLLHEINHPATQSVIDVYATELTRNKNGLGQVIYKPGNSREDLNKIFIEEESSHGLGGFILGGILFGYLGYKFGRMGSQTDNPFTTEAALARNFKTQIKEQRKRSAARKKANTKKKEKSSSEKESTEEDPNS